MLKIQKSFEQLYPDQETYQSTLASISVSHPKFGRVLYVDPTGKLTETQNIFQTLVEKFKGLIHLGKDGTNSKLVEETTIQFLQEGKTHHYLNSIEEITGLSKRIGLVFENEKSIKVHQKLHQVIEKIFSPATQPPPPAVEEPTISIPKDKEKDSRQKTDTNQEREPSTSTSDEKESQQRNEEQAPLLKETPSSEAPPASIQVDIEVPSSVSPYQDNVSLDENKPISFTPQLTSTADRETSFLTTKTALKVLGGLTLLGGAFLTSTYNAIPSNDVESQVADKLAPFSARWIHLEYGPNQMSLYESLQPQDPSFSEMYSIENVAKGILGIALVFFGAKVAQYFLPRTGKSQPEITPAQKKHIETVLEAYRTALEAYRNETSETSPEEKKIDETSLDKIKQVMFLYSNYEFGLSDLKKIESLHHILQDVPDQKRFLSALAQLKQFDNRFETFENIISNCTGKTITSILEMMKDCPEILQWIDKDEYIKQVHTLLADFDQLDQISILGLIKDNLLKHPFNIKSYAAWSNPKLANLEKKERIKYIQNMIKVPWPIIVSDDVYQEVNVLSLFNDILTGYTNGLEIVDSLIPLFNFSFSKGESEENLENSRRLCEFIRYLGENKNPLLSNLCEKMKTIKSQEKQENFLLAFENIFRIGGASEEDEISRENNINLEILLELISQLSSDAFPLTIRFLDSTDFRREQFKDIQQTFNHLIKLEETFDDFALSQLMALNNRRFIVYPALEFDHRKFLIEKFSSQLKEIQTIEARIGTAFALNHYERDLRYHQSNFEQLSKNEIQVIDNLLKNIPTLYQGANPHFVTSEIRDASWTENYFENLKKKTTEPTDNQLTNEAREEIQKSGNVKTLLTKLESRFQKKIPLVSANLSNKLIQEVQEEDLTRLIKKISKSIPRNLEETLLILLLQSRTKNSEISSSIEKRIPQCLKLFSQGRYQEIIQFLSEKDKDEIEEFIRSMELADEIIERVPSCQNGHIELLNTIMNKTNQETLSLYRKCLPIFNQNVSIWQASEILKEIDSDLSSNLNYLCEGTSDRSFLDIYPPSSLNGDLMEIRTLAEKKGLFKRIMNTVERIYLLQKLKDNPDYNLPNSSFLEKIQNIHNTAVRIFLMEMYEKNLPLAEKAIPTISLLFKNLTFKESDELKNVLLEDEMDLDRMISELEIHPERIRADSVKEITDFLNQFKKREMETDDTTPDLGIISTE